MADSRPAPGPFTRTSISTTPCFLASLAANWAARWAANGVLLRAPVNFLSPPAAGTEPAAEDPGRAADGAESAGAPPVEVRWRLELLAVAVMAAVLAGLLTPVLTSAGRLR